MAGSKDWNDFYEGVQTAAESSNTLHPYQIDLIIGIDVLGNHTQSSDNKIY
jgi:hypothetical protein